MEVNILPKFFIVINNDFFRGEYFFKGVIFLEASISLMV